MRRLQILYYGFDSRLKLTALVRMAVADSKLQAHSTVSLILVINVFNNLKINTFGNMIYLFTPKNYTFLELAIISEKNFTQNLEGANVTITCEARNLDTNPVSWYFNDEQIAVALTEDEKSIVYLVTK